MERKTNNRNLKGHPRMVNHRRLSEQMEQFDYKDSAINFGVTDPTFRQAIIDHNTIKKNIEKNFEGKFKAVADFIADQEKREPDHTIEAERKRLHLDESLFASAVEVVTENKKTSHKKMRESVNSYIGTKVVFQPINFDPGFGYDTDDAQLKDHLGKKASIVKCDIDNSNFDDSFWTLEFEDGYILDGIEGVDVNKLNESRRPRHLLHKLTEKDGSVDRSYSYESKVPGMTEETVKGIIDNMIDAGINPWEPGIREDVMDYLSDEMNLDEKMSRKYAQCIDKYTAEHNVTDKVWNVVYNETVADSGNFRVCKFQPENIKVKDKTFKWDTVRTDIDKLMFSSKEAKDFDWVRKVADFYHLETKEDLDVSTMEDGKKVGTNRFTIYIPTTIGDMDVFEYLDSVGASYKRPIFQAKKKDLVGYAN